jgi:hypothetical protein
MVLYLCVLIVFSLHRESLKLILAMNPSPRWFCHTTGGAIGPWCIEHGVLWWMHWLLRRAHPWPHGHGASPGIVGGPCGGVATPAEVTGATIAIDFVVPLALAFAPIVGGGCHTPFRERGNEASIRVPRMFKSHVRPTIWWTDTISH